MSRPGASGYLEGAAGTRLHYRAWPAEAPRAVLLVLHGLFEHSRRYEELGETMAAAGIATYALDHRGHGASEGRRGHVKRFRRFIEDTDRFVEHVSHRAPDGVPRFLLAHSMGGLIGLRYLEDRQPALGGAIFTSPWLATAAHVPAWQVALAKVLDRALPVLPFPAGIDADELSHDPERVADYREDPAIFSTLTPRLWEEAARASDEVFRQKDRLQGPLLFLLAGDDRIADTDRALELARSLPGESTTVRVLDGRYHEVLQETDRTAVMAEIREWIEARAS